MTVFKAFTLLICLAMVSMVCPYPVGMPQTAENKGRGRSYPLIISHYSNVRNSKYNSPVTTDAGGAVKESDDLNEDDDIHNQSASSLLNASDSKKDEDMKEVETDEKKDNEKSGQTELPNMVNADSAAVSKNESISVVPTGEPIAATEDSLLVSKVQTDVEVVPSNEKTEVIDELKLTEASADLAVKETDSTGATLTHFKEEVPTQTTSFNETDKPVALGESNLAVQVNTTIEMGTVAKIQEPATEPIVPVVSASNEEMKQSDESTTVKVTEAAIIDEVTPESTLIETSRTAVLATEKEKTGEFFEDRSFKDRPDPELILEAIRQGAAVFGVGQEPKSLPSPIDDVANEGIRLQRDDNKKTADKKEKEKEKYSAKPTKEKKPIKQIQSNDPVQEYDDVVTRAGKSKDDLESTTDTSDVIDKALTPEEPITLSLVPSNYPVVLASGESTLSDQLTPENAESSKTAEESSLTPTNYPIVLPSGESTLSDKITLEETKSSASEEPIVFSLVPSNYPVVLPSGVSTLSDKVKPEDLESPKAEKTVEK